MKKILFVGDYTISTGFGRVNAELLKAFPRDQWDVHVLAVNATGDACPEQREAFIYPAMTGGEVFGTNRVAGLVADIQPDIVVLHNDSWVCGLYLKQIKAAGLIGRCPIIAYCPPDAENQAAAFSLNDATLVLCPTNWGTEQLKKGGCTVPTDVLRYGVDMDRFTPGDKREARKALGFPDHMLDAFVVGRADRNAPRKRYDLTLAYFAEFLTVLKKAGADTRTVFLHLHCDATEIGGINLPQVATFFGVDEQIIFPNASMHMRNLVSDETLVNVYRSWDLHWSPAAGEGHGLVAHESGACGVPQLLGNYGAWAEIWNRWAAVKVRPEGRLVHCGGVNTVGWVPSREDTIRALVDFRGSAPMRETYGTNARNTATNDRYRWSSIRAEFLELCEGLVELKARKEAA